MEGKHDDIKSNIVYGLKGSTDGERKEIEVETGKQIKVDGGHIHKVRC